MTSLQLWKHHNSIKLFIKKSNHNFTNIVYKVRKMAFKII